VTQASKFIVKYKHEDDIIKEYCENLADLVQSIILKYKSKRTAVLLSEESV